MAANLYRVILPTDDMAASSRFFGQLLQIEIDEVVPTRHYLPTAGAILAIVDPREHERKARPNPDNVYIRVPDLDAAWERARALRAPIGSRLHGEGIARRPWGHRSFYTRDPFGNPVCLVDDVASEVPAARARYAGHARPNLCDVVLPTRNLGRGDAFFEAMLGLPPDTFVPGRHTFYCDSCMLSLVDTVEHARAHETAPDPFRPNVEVTYFAVADLEACFETARALGMPPLDDHPVGFGIETRPWGERSFYGRDPSDNPVCFVDEKTLFTGSADWSRA